MKSIICLLTEWTLKASGLFKANSTFLIKEGTCAVAKDIAFCSEGEIGHAPKCVAYAFVDVWKQILVIRIISCFLFGITSLWFKCMWDLDDHQPPHEGWRFGR